jgi:hypothetical protein
VKIRLDRVRDLASTFTASPVARAIRSLCASGAGAQPAQKERPAASHRVPASKVRFESFEPRVLKAADPVLITGALDSPGETDRYTFTLTADSQVVFDSLTNNGNINWTLTGPHGEVVTARGFDSSDSANFSGTPVLDLAAGEYTLKVDGAGDTAAAYGFRLINLADATELTVNTPRTGTLTDPKQSDSYSFTAVAGERLYFDVQSTTGLAAHRPVRPAGARL